MGGGRTKKKNRDKRLSERRRRRRRAPVSDCQMPLTPPKHLDHLSQHIRNPSPPSPSLSHRLPSRSSTINNPVTNQEQKYTKPPRRKNNGLTHSLPLSPQFAANQTTYATSRDEFKKRLKKFGKIREQQREKDEEEKKKQLQLVALCTENYANT